MSANFSSPRSSAITNFLNGITAPARQIIDNSERRKAQLSSLIALINILFNGLGTALAPQQSAIETLWASGPLIGLSFIAYILTRTRFFKLGAFLVVLSLFTSAYTGIILIGQDIVYTLLVYISIGLVIGSALLSGWILFLLLGINAAFTLFGLPAFGITLPANIGGALGPLSSIGFILILLNYFRETNEKQRVEEIKKTNQELLEIRENLEKRVEERTQELNRRSTQLEASTLVARSAAMVRNLDELLENVVEQISERFGFYHTAIFLTDSAEKFITLQAASSEGGRQMLQRGLKMEISRQGVVGLAAYQKRPRIVQDVSTDSTYIHLPELPETRSEVALPLIVRNRVIGVLDIQSEESNAFKFDDIYTLQTMADQVALAIDNTILLEESRAALQQLETLNANNAANIWKTRLQEGPRGFTYTPLGVTPLSSKNEGKEANEAEKTISIPVNLRGKSIGTISLKRKSNDPNWVEAEREMAERVASQVALAVENARLLEESQRRAAREQKVSEFSNRFSRSLDVDALLQNAVRELHSLPQVAEVAVLINPEQDTDKAK